MTILEFKSVVLSKSTNRKELPDDFYERVFSSLKRVAKDTLPLILTKVISNDNIITFPVLRKIDSETYVQMPTKPTTDEDVLTIDDELIDAVALLTMSTLEKQNLKTYMGLYYKEIEMNDERLIMTSLSDENQCFDRFQEYP